MIQQEPEEELTDEGEPKAVNEEDLAELKRQAEDYMANWQRTQADFDNYKRRSQQEKEEISQFANSVLVLSLLPVIDDLERAFAVISAELESVSWVEGVRLIERKMKTVLEAHGMSEINALGEPFDPSLHEAVQQSTGKENIIVGEALKGYKLHDKVIRPSKVIVGNGDEEVKKED